MRGRYQAGLVAAFGNLVPLLSTATVGLVVLRRGRTEGALVLLWAMLPLILVGSASGAGSIVTVASIASLFIVLAGAEVLKATVSWSMALTVCVLGSALSVLLISSFFGQQVQELEQALAAFFADVAKQSGNTEEVVPPSVTMLLGTLGYITLLNSVASLVVSRWWQAMLYNPGGFRVEMHQLRINLYPAVLLMLGVAGCYLVSPDYISWASVLGLPLLISGLCLIHYIVAASGMGGHWLVGLYIGVILFTPLTIVLITVGFADSVMNLRSRLPVKGDH